MSGNGFLENILAQPESLRCQVEHHLGAGRAALEAAAAAIRGAGRIVISGMGSSYFAGMVLAYRLAEDGVAAECAASSELLHYLHPSARNAVVVLVSRSGESVEVVRLIPLLRLAGAKIVGVTNVPDSRLACEADVSLVVGSRPDHAIAVQTYTGTVLALLLLGDAVVGSMCGVPGRVFGAMRETLEESLEASAGWEAFLEGCPMPYLLARGPAIASARQGALLFHEAARCRAVAMSAGAFRHGPVEAVGADFRALVFALDPRTRALNLALAEDVRGVGGQAAAIGPAGARGCPQWRTPDVPARFAPLVEILPVEIAVWRVAMKRGVPSGEFRYSSQVTTAETGLRGC